MLSLWFSERTYTKENFFHKPHERTMSFITPQRLYSVLRTGQLVYYYIEKRIVICTRAYIII